MAKLKHDKDELGCDFCKSTNIAWCYPAESFTQQVYSAVDLTVDLELMDSWLACSPCYKLIEKNDREKLVKRSLKSYKISTTSKVYPSLKARVLRLHDEFFFRRTTSAPFATQG